MQPVCRVYLDVVRRFDAQFEDMRVRDMEDRQALLGEMDRLMLTGHLTMARLYHAGGQDDRMPLPLAGVTEGWFLESLLDAWHMQAIQRHGRVDRLRLLHGRSGDDWQFAMTVGDYGALQHRVILPLLGGDVRAMLADVTGGKQLTQVMSAPQADTGFAIQAEQTIRAAPALLHGVASLPERPFELVGQVLEEVVRLAGTVQLPGEASRRSRRDVVVSACLPNEVLDLAHAALAGRRQWPTLN